MKPPKAARQTSSLVAAIASLTIGAIVFLLTGCSETSLLPINTESADNLPSIAGAPPRQQPPEQAPQPTGDDRLPGGATTVFVDTEDAFSQAAPNLSPQSLRRHAEGDTAFAIAFAARATATNPGGLGPIFNHVSCESCHVGDGRGHPVAAAGEMNTLLLRVGVAGADAHGEPLPLPGFGGQIQDQAVRGVQKEAEFSIAYTEQQGTFADGTPYSLRVPRYIINNPYVMFPMNAQVSPRIASPVFGLGLLEAVPEATIVGFADPDDRNRDGISGKANYVWNVREQRTTLGRFGWKANQPTLTQQNAAAFNGDMGVTSSLFPNESSAGQPQAIAAHPPEISDGTVGAVTHYTRTLGVPARRNLHDPAVQRGKQVFAAANCTGCHIPAMRTASVVAGGLPTVPELSNQVIFPYTDMLVHDMGEGLADNRPDFAANGREWRTPPLWGIGLTGVVNKHTFLLHDGRARNLMEAILWHGGEAAASREYVRALPRTDRDALVKFLESL
jgi:CxxC motif-containing protein (DUF1111 family)